jgi:hypothetical protein
MYVWWLDVMHKYLRDEFIDCVLLCQSLLPGRVVSCRPVYHCICCYCYCCCCCRVLDAELEAVLLSKAGQLGLPAEWVALLDDLDSDRRQVCHSCAVSHSAAHTASVPCTHNSTSSSGSTRCSRQATACTAARSASLPAAPAFVLQVLRVRSTVAASDAARQLRSGDLLLAVNGRPVTCFADVETLVAAAGGGVNDTIPTIAAAGAGAAAGAAAAPADDAAVSDTQRPAKRLRPLAEAAAPAAGCGLLDGVNDSVSDGVTNRASEGLSPRIVSPPTSAPCVSITLFRDGAVSDVSVRLACEDSLGTDRLLHWCGAQLQAPHRAVRELGFKPDGQAGVFISRWHHGSPAHRYGLFALHWITHVRVRVHACVRALQCFVQLFRTAPPCTAMCCTAKTNKCRTTMPALTANRHPSWLLLQVNGCPTPDLDAFVEAVTPLRDGDFARVRVCHLETTQYKARGAHACVPHRCGCLCTLQGHDDDNDDAHLCLYHLQRAFSICY